MTCCWSYCPVAQFPHLEIGALGPCLMPVSQGSCEDEVCNVFCSGSFSHTDRVL